MGKVAGPLLRLGRVQLVGATPNGQRFRTGPARIWIIRESIATLEDVDLGPIGALTEQARLGDFWIPQRGVLAHGRAWFDSPDLAA